MNTKSILPTLANPDCCGLASFLAFLLFIGGMCLFVTTAHAQASLPADRFDAASTVEKKPPQAEKPGHLTDFSYSEIVENPGSKSAGVRGELRYRGHLVPPEIGQIKTPIGSYHYLTSALLWRPQGWFPAKEFSVGNTLERITPTILQAGRYPGPRRDGTPENWCYLPLENSWIDPNQWVSPADPSSPIQGLP